MDQVNLTDQELAAALKNGLFDDPAVVNKLDSDSRRRLTRIQSMNAPPPTEPDLSEMPAPLRFMGGVAKTMNPVPFAMALKQDPIGAARGLVQAQGDQFSQGYQQLTGGGGIGDMVSGVGHLAAGALPILGPAAAQAGETIAGGDVAGGIGQATGLLSPFLAKPVARGAVRMLPNAVADIADRGSTARLVDVMAPKVGAKKVEFGNMAANVAPELAREPGMGALSREGLSAKVDAQFEAAKHGLDAAGQERNNAQAFPTGPIIAKLREAKARLTAAPVEGSRRIPSLSGEGVREVGVDPMHQYALRWMKDEMESFPFTRHTWNDAPGRTGNAGGGHMDLVPGSGGAPIYNAVIASGIKATRAEVTTAINEVLAGNTEGTLRQAVASVAKELSEGGAAQGDMLTPGPIPVEEPASRTLQVAHDKPATETPRPMGRPIGEPVVPTPNQGQAGVIDQAIEEVRKLGPLARYESLRRIREAYDKPASARYNAATTPDFQTSQAAKMGAVSVTGALRDALAEMDPATAGANATYSLWKNAKDVLDATAEREQVRPKVGRGIMARASGAMVGAHEGGVVGAGIGAAIASVVDKLVDASPTTKIYTARLLASLADAIRNNRPAQVAGIKAKLAKVGGAAGAAGGTVGAASKVADQQVPEDRTARR
jgi:hypothetical protein